MAKRKRTSLIWRMGTKELGEIVRNSTSFSDILRYFNFAIASGNYRTLKERLDFDDIDYSHISQGLNNNKGRRHSSRAVPLEEVMVENSIYSRGSLKKRLLKENLIKNECSICGSSPEWRGEYLVMVLDHINGKNNDNRKENLRLLCPNCNSQTKTFSGKNRQAKKTKYYCRKCEMERDKNSKSELCKKCFDICQRKVDRPPVEKLLKEIQDTSYYAVGQKYGVSDSCIRKWLKL